MNKQKQRMSLWANVYLHESVHGVLNTENIIIECNEAVKAFDEAFSEQVEPTPKSNKLIYADILNVKSFENTIRNALKDVTIYRTEMDEINYLYKGVKYCSRIGFATRKHDKGLLIVNEDTKEIDSKIKDYYQAQKITTTAEPTQPETESWEEILRGALGDEVYDIKHYPDSVEFWLIREKTGEKYRVSKVSNYVCAYKGKVTTSSQLSQEIESKIKAYLSKPKVTETTPKEDFREVECDSLHDGVFLTREEADELWRSTLKIAPDKYYRAKELLKIK